MKRLTISLASSLLLIFATGNFAAAQEQEYLGLPGDNLNLFAVMKLFQESETLESFERGLNDEKLNINNLDLNGDNRVDYINVTDVQNGNVHNIVLQVAVTANEIQDVAVINVFRDSHDQLHVQCIGDEDLYGKDYIIEPNAGYAEETPNPGYTGTHHTEVHTTTYVEVNTWPLIRFIFLPTYVAWHSPWHYGYYPTYWNPWNPFYWHYYYGYHSNMHDYYAHHYRYYHEYRDPHWHDFYHDRRAASPMVHRRIEEGHYRPTYSHPEQREEGRNKYISQHPEQNQPGNKAPQQNNTIHGKRPSTDHNTTGQGTHGSSGRPNGNNVGKQGSRSNASTGGGRPATSTNGSKPATGGNVGRPATATGTGRPSATTSAGRPSTATSTSRPSTSNAGNGGRPATSVNRGSNVNTTPKSTGTSVNRPSAPAKRESAGTVRGTSGTSRPSSTGRVSTGSNRSSSSVSGSRPSNASGNQVRSTSVNKSSNTGSKATSAPSGRKTTGGSGQSSSHQKPSSTRGGNDKK